MAYQIEPLDPAAFSMSRICPLRHTYVDHPLLQLPALGRLAKDLYPRNLCRFIKPGTKQTSAFDSDPTDPRGRNIDEVFARIEEPGSWIALYQVEEVAAYREFLAQLMTTVGSYVEREQHGTLMVHGFIFVSAPPSVTPFHIDRENNFWLQVRGRKTVNVWEHCDREVVSASAVERFILYAEGVSLDEAFKSRSHEFDVGPGEGVYWPSTSPHMTRCDPGWTRPGDGVSISIGVNFYTPHTRRVANIHAWNYFMRRVGLTPRDPGSSPLDPLKYRLGRALVWGKKTFRGYKPKAGLL